jgi:F0F1-type ATP synthase beta subunit
MLLSPARTVKVCRRGTPRARRIQRFQSQPFFVADE